MATNTYVALAVQTLGSAVNSVTFSSIPSGYTDLIVVSNFALDGTGLDVYLRVGTGSVDTTGGYYSYTALYANGSSPGAMRASNANWFANYYIAGANTSRSVMIHQLQNYSNTSIYKTVLSRINTAATELQANVGLWRKTTAIDTIRLEVNNGANNFVAGSVFAIYGIAASDNSYTAKATGGTTTADAGYIYHTFTSSGTFTPTTSVTADILVVAGGGGGNPSGGGAGGLVGFSSQSLTAQGYTITVGSGGAGGGTGGPGAPTNGTNSQFAALTAAVGGGAGNATGAAGGSGGGGASTGLGGAGTSGQGYGGGNGATNTAGGGGGAGAAGQNASVNGPTTNGGIGATYNTTVGGTAGPYAFINAMGAATGTGQLSGSNYYYAGGGVGVGYPQTGTPGLGGGSTGNATANTGGGGGGVTSTGNGGSGIVIIRYPR